MGWLSHLESNPSLFTGRSMFERKACHNCRRRRLRCDRSVPGCLKCAKQRQECLGYGQLYRWVDTDRRDSGTALLSSIGTSHDLLHEDDNRASHDQSIVVRQKHFGQVGLTITLSDPLLQDLDRSSRHYLLYFASRFCQDLVVHDSAEHGLNPFRELIPMSQSYPYLQHIVIAVSAVHYYHAVRHNSCRSSGDVRQVLIDALRARQQAIEELITVLNRPPSTSDHMRDQKEQDALLATVLFFVNFTLIDSGKDGWRTHLTAAGQLLSLSVKRTALLSLPSITREVDGAPVTPAIALDDERLAVPETMFPGTLGLAVDHVARSPSACDYVASDTVAYFIWNGALDALVATPSPRSNPSPDYAVQPTEWDVSKVMTVLSRTEANSYHSCPAHLMGIVLRVSRLGHALKTSPNRTLTPSITSKFIALLKEAEDFDAEGWATTIATHVVGSYGVVDEGEVVLRSHIAATYRAAVCLYILLLAPTLPTEIRKRSLQTDASAASLPFLFATDDLAITILQRLSFVPNTSPFFKFTTWPVFLVGIDAFSSTRRAWVTDRLCGMRDLCPWGMLTTAMETLEEIWKLRDHGSITTQAEKALPGETTSDEAPEHDKIEWLARIEGLKIDCLIV
ncbi:fungal-specific transcription factor domain-containing protein [Xylariaceae sp. FL1019]|nr:fungal-specific transcription factor domain-containing protein [Xylariaceae sp. FL1019]